MKKEEIINTIETQFDFLQEKYRVKKIGLFGSVARGEDNNQSDIDILVEFDSPVGFFEFIRLENYLSDLLGKKVDLISKKAVKPAVRDEIFKEVVYV